MNMQDLAPAASDRFRRLLSSTPFRLAAVTAAVVAVGAWIVVSATPPPVPVVVSAPPEQAVRPAAVPALARPAPSGARAELAPPPPEESLAARVDRLSRSPRPADAYAAYKLVRACVDARRLVQQGRGAAGSEQSACADLASDQIQARLAWLDRAARAGVRNAATDYGTEGPAGLLVPPEAQGDWSADKGWQERLAAYYDRGALDCDLGSTLSVLARYRLGKFPPDARVALTTWSAAQECIALGKTVPEPPDPRDAGVATTLGALLGPAEAEAAIAAGKAGARVAAPFGTP